MWPLDRLRAVALKAIGVRMLLFLSMNMPPQMKQMRHWSLIRMLHCPARLPLSCSSRLPGGLRNSSILLVASMSLSFRRAIP
jgi:hypothetical protein